MKYYAEIDTLRIPIKGLVPEAGSAPATPVDGQLYYNTTSKKLFEYNATTTTWQEIIRETDTRLTDGRAPTGAASGDLAGSYPGPTIGANKVITAALADGAATLAKLAANSVDSSKIVDDSIVLADLNSALSGPAAGVFGLRKLIGGDGSATSAFASNTRLNELAPANGQVSFNNQLATNMATCLSGTDGANKNYVDTVAQGLDAKASVRAATTVSISAGGIPGGAQTVDGFATGNQERILVKNQSTPANNGIWITNSGGSWARATDLDTWGKVPGAFVFVEEGTTQADTGWVSTADQTGTLGTTAITWAQFSSAGSYTGGNGLTLTGNDFAVNVDSSSIEINADILRVKALGITNAMLAGSIDLTAKVTGQLPVANGGTGAPTVAAARNNLVVPGKATIASPALTANTWSANIAHGLGPIITVPQVQITEAATGENVVLDWKVIDVNNIQLRAGIAVSAAALNVLVQA